LLKKTVYFTNEEPENGKVIGGLFVDSDLLIKYNDEDCEKLEEGTVMNLLNSHSYRLYRDSLSYDPYIHRSGVVQNGKSYLKWCVPGVGKEKNISKIKELKVVFDFNVTTNKNVINPIKTLSTASYFVCLSGYIGLFFLLIIFIFSFFKQNEIGSHFGGFLRCSSSFNLILFIIFVVSSLLVLIATILAGINIGHISTGNKLDLGTNIFNTLIIFDIVIICMNIVLLILICIFCLYLFVTPKYLPDQESITQYKTYQDNNKAIECADFKNNDNKDDYYNSSDFKNNTNTNNDNNKDPYYNSSDFNNNNNNNNYYNSSDFNKNTNTNNNDNNNNYYNSSDFKNTNDNNKDPYYNSSDFKNTNDNNNNYYNSSDFNNNTNTNTNTNKDDYYNSSDYNSNLLNNPPQQTNSGL